MSFVHNNAIMMITNYFGTCLCCWQAEGKTSL